MQLTSFMMYSYLLTQSLTQTQIKWVQWWGGGDTPTLSVGGGERGGEGEDPCPVLEGEEGMSTLALPCLVYTLPLPPNPMDWQTNWKHYLPVILCAWAVINTDGRHLFLCACTVDSGVCPTIYRGTYAKMGEHFVVVILYMFTHFSTYFTIDCTTDSMFHKICT